MERFKKNLSFIKPKYKLKKSVFFYTAVTLLKLTAGMLSFNFSFVESM